MDKASNGRLKNGVESEETGGPRYNPIEVTNVSHPAVGYDDLDTSLMRDSYSATAAAEVLDRSFHAGLARYTSGISPAALTNAYVDWAIHLWVPMVNHHPASCGVADS